MTYTQQWNTEDERVLFLIELFENNWPRDEIRYGTLTNLQPGGKWYRMYHVTVEYNHTEVEGKSTRNK